MTNNTNDFVTMSKEDYATLVELADEMKAIIDANRNDENIEDNTEYCQYDECPVEKISEELHSAYAMSMLFECIMVFGFIVAVVACWFADTAMTHACHVAMTLCAGFSFVNFSITRCLSKVSGILAIDDEECETDKDEPTSEY